MLCRTFWNNKYIYISVLATDQLNAQILVFLTLLFTSTCFEHCCAHHQEVKLYYTASVIVKMKQVGGLKLLNTIQLELYLVILDHPLVSV